MNIFGKKILVTGGAGFIGSHIVESLVIMGAKVRIYDNFSSGSWDNLRNVKNKIEIIKGDILDKEKLTKSMKGIDIVSHQAAQLEITKCIEDPIEDLITNTVGSLNVFEAALKNNVQKIINVSSACVYGQAQKIPEKENDFIETPNWAYGVSKLATEKYANIFQELYGIPIISLRYAIIYGPREWYGRVLTIFLKRALQKKPLIVFGKGKEIRDFTFVSDVVDLHNKCIEYENKKHEVFNGSTEIGTTIGELAEKCREITGEDIKIIFDKEVKEGERSKYINRLRLPSELKVMVLANQKAKRLLNWKPKITLEKGLTIEYKWLKDNYKRWEKMSY